MTKKEFLAQLRSSLSALPGDEAEEQLNFYSEMIDDCMEEGFSEEEAVDRICASERFEGMDAKTSPKKKRDKEHRQAKKRLHAWEIVLLALGSPIWLSLLIAVFAVAVSLYVSLWAVAVSLWAVFGALVGASAGVFAAGLGFALGAHTVTGIAMIGAGIACAGLSVFAFFGCRAATLGTAWLTKKSAHGIKACFVRKEHEV